MQEELRTNVVSTIAAPGRSLNRARGHVFVVDGPPHHGGPGEELTPAELFLAGVSACGALLVEAHARETGVPLRGAEVTIDGVRRADAPWQFVRVDLRFRLDGPSRKQAQELVRYYEDS